MVFFCPGLVIPTRSDRIGGCRDEPVIPVLRIVHRRPARQLGYTLPTPVEPRDEAAELQRQYIEATRALMKMSERIERLRSVA